MPQEKTLTDLFVDELQDMYHAEKQLIRALPKMAKAAESAALQDAFNTHLEETRSQLERLEQVFKALGKPAKGKTCEGMQGIIEEGSGAIDAFEGSTLDAALIAGAQKAEHYEIASYGTLARFAELLGYDQAKKLLGQNLQEEKAADEKLTQIAEGGINEQAMEGAGAHRQEEEEEAEEMAGAGASRSPSGKRTGEGRGSTQGRGRTSKR